MVVGLVLPMSAPAHAIFGLSQCEKTKKAISSLETQTIKLLDGVRGDYYTTNISGYDSKIFILSSSGVASVDSLQKLDPIPKIWKLAFNNPSCFTNTQNLRVTALGKMRTNDFADYSVGKKYKYSDYCKGADSLFNSNSQKLNDCFLADIKTIFRYNKYKSIYDF
jgi:hypothetical protein